MKNQSIISSEKIENRLERYSIGDLESAAAVKYLEDNEIDVDKDNLINSYITNFSPSRAQDILELDRKISFQDIIRIFELCSQNRKLNGIYYTPREVTSYIVERTVGSGDTVCDFACGSGAFLLEATDYIYSNSNKTVKSIIQNQLYGCDIIERNIRQCKILLILYAASKNEQVTSISFNLACDNSLTFEWKNMLDDSDKEGFDSVIGNPPYIKIQNLSDADKETIKQKYETAEGGNYNIFIPFIELANNITSSSGRIGLITPLNYFTTITGKEIREYLQNKKLVREIVDFGERLLFEDALIYTAITIMDKKRKSKFEYKRIPENIELSEFKNTDSIDINYNSLSSDKWRLLSQDEYNIINKIESFRKLSDICEIRTGIATLRDAVYTIEDTNKNEDKYYFKNYNGDEYPIEKSLTRELVKISKVGSESDLKNNNRRIIFPYKEKSNQDGQKRDFEIIEEETLKKKYPKTYSYFQETQDELYKREGGDAKSYEPWYKYGRKQGINLFGKRLYIPTYSDGPKFMLHENESSLFCNGYAVFPTDIRIKTLKKVLNSDLMDYYMQKTSKDIQGGYQCYQKNFIQNFSVPKFTDSEEDKLEKLSQKKKNEFLRDKYNISSNM
jgi:adenine-specific DNA-methyltransferase